MPKTFVQGACMWLFWLVIAVLVLLYLGGSKTKRARKGRGAQAMRKKARPVFAAADLAGFAPITSQATAAKALEHLLVSAGYEQVYKDVLRQTLSDFRLEIREHVGVLQQDVEECKHELDDERQVLEMLGDPGDSEGEAERVEHARHLERVRALEAQLAQRRARLKQYTADRSAFTVAYANHVLHDMPSPNLARQ